MTLKVYFEDEPKMIDEHDPQLRRFERIIAAGGVVTNKHGDVLMIFRRGKWDLPKGKFEEGETIEACAEREVREETGLRHLHLRRFLLITYHTYEQKGVSYLKATHWFAFESSDEQALRPQIEEDIAEAEWSDKSALSAHMNNTFALIRDVLAAAKLL